MWSIEHVERGYWIGKKRHTKEFHVRTVTIHERPRNQRGKCQPHNTTSDDFLGAEEEFSSHKFFSPKPGTITPPTPTMDLIDRDTGELLESDTGIGIRGHSP